MCHESSLCPQPGHAKDRDERQMILQMLADGKITVDQANELIQAVEPVLAPARAPRAVAWPGEQPLPPAPGAFAEMDAFHREMAAFSANLSRSLAPQMAKMAAQLAPLKKIGRNPRLESLTSLASLGVRPEYVREMRDALGNDVGVDEIMGAHAIGVQPEYVSEMRDVLGASAGLEEIMGFHTLGISPDYVADMREALGGDVEFDAIMGCHALGIAADYVADVREVLGDVSLDELMQLHSLGIRPDYLEEMRDAAGEAPSVEDLLSGHAAAAGS